MSMLTFYPAFLGTFLSVTSLSYLAWREHDSNKPRTLSELGASRVGTLTFFRIVLGICGTLFAITMFFFVIPKVTHSLWQLVAWIIYYGDELLLAMIPARGAWEWRLHNVFAYAMSAGMLVTALLFIINLHDIASQLEIGMTAAMIVLGGLTFWDRKRCIFYELAFIYVSHFTILVAASALYA